jgi:BirA family biotin operon repressor/biotin-[acetyl-CoA-carboxylase] ligase
MMPARPFVNADQLRGSTFIRHVEIHDTLDSTNNRAADLAHDAKVELPALVIARLQTAGRGRGNNTWWSADGALTFSVVIEPATVGISTANWPQLSLTTAVAICDGLELQIADCGLRIHENDPRPDIQSPQSSFPLAIKWPNDVMLDGAKVAGVLIESPSGSAPAKERLIIGIGINVNNSWQTAPRNFGPNGAALCDATKTQHDLQTVLVTALQALEERIRHLARGLAPLPDDWQRLCWLTEQSVEVHSGQRSVTGVCAGIDRDGALMVESANGIQRVHSGSVRVV